jgi:D-hydroxyproline dehydrogenase subunit gamma
LSARRIDAAFQRPPAVTIEVDGRPVEAAPGESLAAALLVAGRADLRRSVVRNDRRGPFCMMGVCQECVVEVDGAMRQACLVPVQVGLVVRTGWAGDD